MSLKFVLVGFRHDKENSVYYKKGKLTSDEGLPDMLEISNALRLAIGHQANIVSIRIMSEEA